MRFIDITQLKETFDRIKGTGAFSAWEDKAKSHLDAIKPLDKKERSKYWSKNNIWAELYSALSELSGDKCWYTESKENSSEWQVDHFRPKAKSIDENGDEILDCGYWWLSYDWKNFRLSGTLTNLLRKGRFEEGEDVFGKGNYFPLCDKTQVAKEGDLFCKDERPILLDPTNARDVSLLGFDRDGLPYEVYNQEDDPNKYLRASVTIKCYGLTHKSLVRGRASVWTKCSMIVDEAQNDLMLNKGDNAKIDEVIEVCFNKLAVLARRTEPHSIIVFNYIKAQSKVKEYEWLEDALIAIA